MEKSLKKATALVLVGMTTAWVGFMLATYWMVMGVKANPINPNSVGITNPATYAFLAALLGQAFFVAWAYRITDVELAKKTPGALPVLKYATVWIVVTALSLFFFAFSAFTTASSLDSITTYRTVSFVELVTGAYIPILLAALGSTALLLSTTVYRKSEMGKGERTPEEKKAKLEAVLAYVFPVLGIALIFILSSIGTHFGASSSIWYWIFILLLVAAALGLGGFYSARTRALGGSQADTKSAKSSTALRLNLTLVVIFIVILTGVSFGTAEGVVGAYTVGNIELGDWLLNYLLPVVAVYTISVVITYFTVRVRSIISAK
jgi:heme/copper-type cytochrome/quinol oxidase subunit 2